MLSPFGKAVRKARIETDTTMTQLAAFLCVSVPFLSAVENGRKSIPSSWGSRIKDFFKSHGLDTDFTSSIALSVKKINLESLPAETAKVLAQLSTVNFQCLPDEEKEKFFQMLKKIEGKPQKNEL